MKITSGSKVDAYVEVGGPEVSAPVAKTPKPVVDWRTQFPREAATAALLAEPLLFAHPKLIAGLIQVPRWYAEPWVISEKENGFRNQLNNDFVSLAELEVAVSARITELDLDRELIEDFIKEPVGPTEARVAWESQPFDQMMNRFRRVSR